MSMLNLLDLLRSQPLLMAAANPFWPALSHFLTLSLLGFGALKVTRTRTSSPPNHLNFFFTAVSAATVSSMSTVEMEVFSNAQLLIVTLLMFLGGEVFVSAAAFHLSRRFSSSVKNPTGPARSIDSELEIGHGRSMTVTDEFVNHEKSTALLGRVVVGYLLAANLIGSLFVFLYVTLVSRARHVLESKGINLVTFSIFTTVSTFTNCGFIPTNENMIVFKDSSGILLALVAQVLLGGCLYPAGLRLVISGMTKVTGKKELRYILNNYSEMGYPHLLSGVRCRYLAGTAAGFVILQMIIFCSLEWNSEGLWDGLNPYRKTVAALFQVTNSRHTGESVVDISVISPAILVLFVVMMYLPPYTTFLPMKNKEMDSVGNGKGKRQHLVGFLKFSQLSYLAIFIILICITEKQQLRDDPLNFTVLNITLEVISAYGNVGFSTGYSCKRQLKADGSCKDAWYGFVGRWSGKGKFILILVMIFGRLKSFSMHGGRAWKLS
ncbi:sodium transporter HKT1 [Momordica charantia]|uniref:Sodium transporter HKT1 n=1 Tax=Momordica charantia TaxID=3673 RepID=A0A6J1C0X2_MOMCH|nr:sodium transporter HKT1 [Momordica charantia]